MGNVAFGGNLHRPLTSRRDYLRGVVSDRHGHPVAAALVYEPQRIGGAVELEVPRIGKHGELAARPGLVWRRSARHRRKFAHQMVQPPSTTTFWPVTNEDSGDTRNSRAERRSFTSPTRFIGVKELVRSIPSGVTKSMFASV